MTRKIVCFAVFAILAGSGLSAQTADEIISKYVAARGGVEKIKAIKTERISGIISFGPDAEGPFLVERQRPLKMYMEIALGGMKMIRAYDGKSSGWIFNPFVANPAVEAMTEADLRNITDEADFDGPFVEYKTKGNQVEFVDKEEVLGKTAYKIKLTSKIGDVSYFYFDADSNLLLKWEGDRKVGTQSFKWESFFHDFREVNGLKYPFLIESDSPGTDERQKITADKIEVNVSIDNAHFGKPAAPAMPTAAAPPDSSAPPAKPDN